MVFPYSLSCRFNGLGKISLFYKYYECSILVVPSEIAVELIDGIKKEFFTFPYFTLCYKEC